MEQTSVKKIIETLLYMTDHPLSNQEIIEVFDKSITEEEILSAVGEIKADLAKSDSGLTLVEVAGGIQIATSPQVAVWVRKLYRERLTVRLSSSALETLSIIAYKQPITRSDIEQIRGVEVTGVMETLLERRLIKVIGRKETIGRPLLYGTTPEFLRQFGLKHLSDLPDLKSISVAESNPLNNPIDVAVGAETVAPINPGKTSQAPQEMEKLDISTN